MEERICVFDDVYNETSARAQADHEKVAAFGMLVRMKLWDRPKEADVNLVSTEKRYEPVWLAEATRRTLFTRHVSYAVTVENATAKTVKMLGQTVPIGADRKLKLSAVEDCELEVSVSDYFDGLQRAGMEKQLADCAGKFAFRVITDKSVVDVTGPDFIVPGMTATSVLQEIRAKLSTPVQADEILEDVLDIRSLSMFYRPVYAFQYGWKDKLGVIEIDGLSGRVNKEGSMLRGSLRGLASREALFDFSAEFANLVVPGGKLVIKLVNHLSKG